MFQKTVFKIVIHSIFWVVYIVVLFVFDPPHYSELGINWYEKIEPDLLLLVGSITYLNELLLLPFFFKRKYYILFAIINFGLLFFATTFYCYYLIGEDCKLSVCLSNNLWLIALPVVFLSLVWVVIQFFEKQKELENVYSERLELELKFLKSQINPHVLFNSLNTIYSKAVKENDEIAEMILKLSDNLKYVLNKSDDTFVDMEKDIVFIENYLDFQKLRTEGINKIIYKKDIDSYNHSIAPLILIDLIENAFKYAIYKEDELSDIYISLNVKNGMLHFICKNEYNPIDLQQQKDSMQIGLKNLKQRLKLLYKNNHQLHINTDNSLFIVDLKINLE